MESKVLWLCIAMEPLHVYKYYIFLCFVLIVNASASDSLYSLLGSFFNHS